MNRTKNIAVITLSTGYSGVSLAFEDTQTALEFMAMLSKAVSVSHDAYTYRNDTPCTYFLAEADAMPELKFVQAHKFNTEETEKEVEARIKREKEDRADMDQKFREAPAALSAPVLVTADDDLDPF